MKSYNLSYLIYEILCIYESKSKHAASNTVARGVEGERLTITVNKKNYSFILSRTHTDRQLYDDSQLATYRYKAVRLYS